MQSFKLHQIHNIHGLFNVPSPLCSQIRNHSSVKNIPPPWVPPWKGLHNGILNVDWKQGSRFVVLVGCFGVNFIVGFRPTKNHKRYSWNLPTDVKSSDWLSQWLTFANFWRLHPRNLTYRYPETILSPLQTENHLNLLNLHFGVPLLVFGGVHILVGKNVKFKLWIWKLRNS